MIDPTEADDSKITHTDWLLTTAYYPILLELAIVGGHRTYTYGELIAKAKEKHPDVPEVQRAIPIGAGRALGVMRKYTNEKHPDLACLVVNAGKDECGKGYTKYFDAVAAREQVYKYRDWALVLASFDGFADREPIKREKRAARTDATGKTKSRLGEAKRRDAATRAMSAYYFANKEVLPPRIHTHRNLIIDLISKGMSAEEAFSRAATSN